MIQVPKLAECETYIILKWVTYGTFQARKKDGGTIFSLSLSAIYQRAEIRMIQNLKENEEKRRERENSEVD